MRKFVSLTLALVILLSACPVISLAISEPERILGDVTLDSLVNIKDATLIQKYSAKLADFADDVLVCADCDLDTKINVKDATWIQKHVANFDCPYPIGEPMGSSGDMDNTTTPYEPTSAVSTTPTTNPTLVTPSVDNTEPYESEPTVTTDSTEATEPNTTVATQPMTEATIPTETFSGIVLPDDEFTKATEVTVPVETYPSLTKPNTNITIYFSNNVSWQTVNAYFYNDKTGAELKSWPGTAMTFAETNDFGEQVYKINVDVSKYNRVVFNNGQSQTLNAAVTVASSGYYISATTPKSAMQVGVYAYGADDYGTKQTFTLKYPTGYNKTIEVVTPAGYNPADTTKKYSVIYLLDGQNQFDDSDAYNGGWGSDEVVTALMQNGGDGIILVGIDNSTNRDSELTPDIGDVIPEYANQGFENGTGIQFASFVADTVVPYIEANYNVYTDAAHSAIVGSSSGGIEAFYIGMEHKDEFGLIGALSPAFMLFDKATWLEYFEKFDFTDTSTLPRIYFYNGGGDSLELELLPDAQGMMSWLADLGYDTNKMTFVYDEKNAHNEAAWRNIMPEVVTWLYELQ